MYNLIWLEHGDSNGKVMGSNTLGNKCIAQRDVSRFG